MANPSAIRLPTINTTINWIYGDWQIIDEETGKSIVEFDTFLSYEYSEESSVPSQSVEAGSFISYNKVNKPSDMSISLAKTGFDNQINKFIKDLKSYSKSTRLVSVILPYETLINQNIIGLSTRKTSKNGRNIVIFDIALKQIKQESQNYSNVLLSSNISNPNDASALSRGKIVAKTPVDSVAVKIRNKLFSALGV